jgi:Peptidase_C39 like family
MKYQIIGLGCYRQRAGGWENENYSFGNQAGNFDHLGCTPTSITNILVWTIRGVGGTIPTPSNTNHKDSVFWDAFGKTTFKDLSYQNYKIESGWFNRVGIGLFKSPISQNSGSGQRLMGRIRESIKSGKPVLLGIRGNSNPRHSVVAAGVDSSDNIWVIDPWTTNSILDNDPTNNDPKNIYASFAPLSVIDDKVGDVGHPYNQFDMAYEASRHP